MSYEDDESDDMTHESDAEIEVISSVTCSENYDYGDSSHHDEVCF